MYTRNKPLILIVDDNSQNIQTLETIIEKNDYTLAMAMNGHDAIDFAIHEKPDLILLDIIMPEMDGYEICQKLKANIQTRDIPVIFLSVKTRSKDIVKGLETGAIDYISKPFHSEEFLARIKAHLKTKQIRNNVQTVTAINPICSKCKKIRDHDGWQSFEKFIANHSKTIFSNSICPECAQALYADLEWFKGT